MINNDIYSSIVTIVEDFPISSITTSKDFVLENIPSWSKVSIDITWKDFDAADATASLKQRGSFGGSLVDIASTSNTLDTASADQTSKIMSVTDFCGYSMACTVTKNAVTTGTFTITAVLKR